MPTSANEEHTDTVVWAFPLFMNILGHRFVAPRSELGEWSFRWGFGILSRFGVGNNVVPLFRSLRATGCNDAHREGEIQINPSP